MANIKQEIEKRRTFAIISHPDAGKTTLTEKFLLYGGAINLAGSVKGKATARHAVSDWMEIEKQRGISVTSSVMQFEYDGKVVSIMDTPGHNDFGEDTYRILTSVDSAVMVIDAAKGVETQTVKLFKVCSMRQIPIFTFINKLDRQSKDPLECMADLEDALGLPSTAVTWPIGNGLTFEGIYDRLENRVYLYKQKNGVVELGANGVFGDALEGVSHSLCSLEYEIHRPLYDWVVEHSAHMRMELTDALALIGTDLGNGNILSTHSTKENFKNSILFCIIHNDLRSCLASII